MWDRKWGLYLTVYIGEMHDEQAEISVPVQNILVYHLISLFMHDTYQCPIAAFSLSW